MKKRITAALLVLIMLTLSGCGSFKVYDINEIIPPLIDVTTQYPYTEKITVTKCDTGETLEFTEGADHDLIRMQFEGIPAIREKLKASASVNPLYEVTFYTTEGSVTVSVLENKFNFAIDGYMYETMRSAIDLLFFENLFLK